VTRKFEPHVVTQGEHVEKLAFLRGADAAEVWDHPANAALKGKRKSMHQLLAGDILHLPVGPMDGLPLEQGTRNRYRARVPVVDVRVSIRTREGPVAGAPYVIEGLPLREGEAPPSGKTGPEGEIHLRVPVVLREVSVRLPEQRVTYQVRVGDLDPAAEPSGAAQRLRNLGFLAAGASADDISSSVASFQRSVGLPVTGTLDEATRGRLEEAAGG
jgi:hypothetical protein